MVWTQYPYTNFHELNLDWILKTMESISTDITVLNEWKATRDERDAYIDATIDQLNRQYEELMLLYNTFIDEVNQRFTDLETEINAEVQQLSEDVTAQVNALELRITNQVNALERNILQEMANFQGSVNALLSIYNSRIIDVETGLRAVEDQIPNMMNIIDPYTGMENTIVNVIYEIVNNTKQNPLTAAAYDTAALTATQYDALNLSAYEYDFNGADYIH